MSYEFRMERLIDATPNEVFDALTDPEAQRQWWTEGASPVEAGCDLRVGGRAHVAWTGDEGQQCRAEQTYLEIERPFRLKFSEVVIEPLSPPYECVLTFTLAEKDGKTLLALHHQGFPTAEERDRHERGTGIFLDRMSRFLSAGASASALPHSIGG
jgi:uncharacterized protein YndB with AHSA1/START domain